MVDSWKTPKGHRIAAYELNILLRGGHGTVEF